jgi:uncharacterized repeat protein (TIGR03803 family)
LIDVNGTLYGTTMNGGGSNLGAVFTITTSGHESVLYAFQKGSDGANPEASLTDVNGMLYGTTTSGGAYCRDINCGTVYSITTSGAEQVLHSFGANGDGVHPGSGLTEVNGTLYGTTAGYQRHAHSTVFALTP